MEYPYQYSDVEFSFYISVYIAGKDHEFLLLLKVMYKTMLTLNSKS